MRDVRSEWGSSRAAEDERQTGLGMWFDAFDGRLLLRSAYAQVLTHASQEIPGVRQNDVDLFPRECELRAVIRGLPIQKRVMQPPRELLWQKRRLDVQLIELRDGAAVLGRLGLAGASSASTP